MSALTYGHRQAWKLRIRQARALLQLGQCDEAKAGEHNYTTILYYYTTFSHTERLLTPSLLSSLL